MKKKTYIIPACDVIRIQTQQMLAASPSTSGLDGFGGYGGNGVDDDYVD